ncbi:hypothetical protein D7X33_28175 [Butyricicoccus sp. 1XD8-22]|nr:hypothetical protein D7X33_28175 [Butyricicoccus sp. 1XD8-22]
MLKICKKYIFPLLLVIFVFLSYLQHTEITKLQSRLGYFYKTEFRTVLSLSSDYSTKYSFNSDPSSELLYEYSGKYLDASLEISRINSRLALLSDTLQAIGNGLRQVDMQPDLVASILKDIKFVNEYVTHINENLTDNEIDWYKNLHESTESELIEQINSLLKN